MLTVFGDPDSLGLVFPDAQQHDDRVEDGGDLHLLQQVVHRLDLLPAWTQQHRDGLDTNTDSTHPDIRAPSSGNHTPHHKSKTEGVLTPALEVREV